jgi:hypothetical protein
MVGALPYSQLLFPAPATAKKVMLAGVNSTCPERMRVL